MTKWSIDAAHSGVTFTVRHMVFTKVRGRFLKHRGTIVLDDANLEGSSVDVEIDAASIDTGIADRDAHLRSPDFFDVEKHPQLRFRSTRIVNVGDGTLRVIGLLTIRDVTREVILDAETAGRGTDPWGNERVGFAAKTTIDRKEFGLTWNKVLEAGGVLVGDRIDIELDVQAVRAAAQDIAA